MENTENNPIIVHNLPKIRKHPKFFLKDFLVKFYEFKQEDHIGHWIANKIIGLFVKIIDVVVTGVLMQVALFPFHQMLFHFGGFTVPVQMIPVWIVSYGLIWAACEKIHESIVEGRIKANQALPKIYMNR